MAQKQPADDDVVVAGYLWVHAHAQVKDGGDAPADIGGTARGLVDAGEQAQQRGLAGAIVANEPDAIAFAQVQVNIPQRLNHHGVVGIFPNGTARGRKHGLF